MLGLVFLALAVGGVVWVARAMARGQNAWDALVAEHHLVVTRDGGGCLRVTGTIGKTPFVYERTKDYGDVSVAIPREEMGDLHISREHVLAKLAKKLGGQDITFDDPTFDRTWRVTCSQPEIARNVLRRSVRIAFHNTQTDLGQVGMLEVREGQLRWATMAGVAPDALPGIVRALGKCARKFAPKKPSSEI